MTDKEIIKALECCVAPNCGDCPIFNNNEIRRVPGKCVQTLEKNSLDLINRQQAQIEKLKEENTILSQNADTAFQDGLNESQDLYAEQIKGKVKAEAVKEVLEKLEKRIFPYGMVNDGNYGINALSIKMTIEKVKKEMGVMQNDKRRNKKGIGMLFR